MKKAAFATAIVCLTASGTIAGEAVAPAASSAVRDRTIGYVVTHDNWAVTVTKDMTECPQGLNDGPREQFDKLFPKDGTKRKIVDTELLREAQIWWPDLAPEPYVFKEAGGKIAPGVNLDGKVDANDFVSPDGVAGIDNQFYRVLGCMSDHRPGGVLMGLWEHFMHYHTYTRVLIELTDVDSLADDDDVTVTMYRGRQHIPTDATGNDYLPFGTQEIDVRWGKKFTKQMKGKIAGGVLTTEPADVNFPHNFAFEDFGIYTMKASQLELSLTETEAHGLWAGYVDIPSWYRMLIGAYGTHSLAYGGQAGATVYKALYRLADAFPDKNGRNTAISGAKSLTFKQTFIRHPEQKVASGNANSPKAAGQKNTARGDQR